MPEKSADTETPRMTNSKQPLKRPLRRIALLCALLFFVGTLYAQETIRYTYTPLPEIPVDTMAAISKKKNFLRRVVDYFGESTRDRTFEKKIDFTFIGGPSYSKDTQFGLGVMAAGLYRIDRTDSISPPSDVSLYATASTTGYYLIGLSGNNLFRRNIHRLSYDFSFSSQPSFYWGIGYAAGAHNAKSSYVEKRIRVDVRYLYRVVPHLYFGPTLGFRYMRGTDFGRPDYIAGQRKSNTVTGIGAVVEYDTRDFIPNPREGVYLSLGGSWMPESLGTQHRGLWQANFTTSGYVGLWRDTVLASEFYGEFHADRTPWSMLAMLGGSRRMRGYYEGRYNDNQMITLQVELRQRIWRRVGAVVWGGAGNVFSAPAAFAWRHTLPNYGVGLRWEFKNRMNIRLDWGFGRRTNGIMFNLGEAF